jgi:hypothetical protein
MPMLVKPAKALASAALRGCHRYHWRELLRSALGQSWWLPCICWAGRRAEGSATHLFKSFEFRGSLLLARLCLPKS